MHRWRQYEKLLLVHFIEQIDDILLRVSVYQWIIEHVKM